MKPAAIKRLREGVKKHRSAKRVADRAVGRVESGWSAATRLK